jgi:hypothetical protein
MPDPKPRRGLSRRQWASALAAAPAALAAQTAPAQPPDLLKNALEQQRRTSEQLAKFNLPMAVEPSFTFKA